MDLAKTVAEWRSRPREQWLAECNRILPPVAAILLVILLAFKGAGLTWRLLEQPAVQDELPPVVAIAGGTAPQATAGDLSPLRNWEPFGRAPAPGEVERISASDLDVEETRLNLRLAGLASVHSLPEAGTMIDVPESGHATIASGRGAPKTYHPGQTIDDASGYKLHSVFTDRVFLDPGGGRPLEKLSWPDAEELAQSVGRLNSNVQTRTQTTIFRPEAVSSPSTAAAVADAAVAAASTAFAQHIQLLPHEDQGRMIGFRLEPRNDSPVMSRLGLEPGDVLTEVNGTPLSDLRNAASVLQTLGQTSQANVKIRRGDAELSLPVNIGDIQRLAESLQ